MKRANIILVLGLCGLAFNATALAAVAPGAPALSPEQLAFFESKIRPVLADKCYSCHSAEAEKVKGGLLLDTREAWMRGGDSGPAIVPGEPDKSRLILAVRYTDEDLQMPPKQKLSEPEIKDLEEWVRMGAPDPRREKSTATAYNPIDFEKARKFWAFQKPGSPAIPKVKDKKWPRTGLDYFILNDLEERKLRPADPAAKRDLIRRATFDLTGLPPRPEEIEAFLADASPESFAKVVDRLLDSPHFGERWGRHWLDVARYADSNGLEANLPFENAWRYRDYVINAFNQDKPFDRFIREQIAGDLLTHRDEEERFEHLIATGFLVLGPKALFEPNREKLVMDVADEQIDVTTKAFLGLTVSCARCHDHKFDPIPTRDYYALAGIFKSTATLSTGGNRQDPGAPRWMERPLAKAEQAREIEAYDRKVNQLAEALRLVQENPGGLNSSKLPGVVMDNSAAELTGRWKVSTYSTNFVDKDYVHDANSDKGKMRARFAPKLPHTGPYEVLLSYTPRYDRATNVPVTIYTAEGEIKRMVDQRAAPTFRRAFVSLGTFMFNAGTNGAVTISNEGTRGFVIADAAMFVPIEEWKLELASMQQREMEMAMPDLKSPGTSSSNLVQVAMSGSLSMAGPLFDQLQVQLIELRSKAPPPVPRAMAVQEGNVGNARINLRGDPERLGEEVPRGFLTVLEEKARQFSLNRDTSGRLELADWIASPENPLTARVAVNRIWLHLFGRGLVDPPDNFGALSERPSHPELLDFLARRFIEQGWSTKKMIREILLSSTYQMSSQFNPKAYLKDPDNRLYWRMNRRRLEAESIRDAMLAVSGQLELTRGGPVLPTNAPPMNAMMSFPQVTSNRRSVYLPVIRNNVSDLLQVFDFVDPHAVSGKRHVTTAAPQALLMMNSEFVQDRAKNWAEQLIADFPKPSQRVTRAYEQAFGRAATAEEIERAVAFVKSFEQAGAGDEASAKTLVAWQSFCQALLASTEFRFLN